MDTARDTHFFYQLQLRCNTCGHAPWSEKVLNTHSAYEVRCVNPRCIRNGVKYSVEFPKVQGDLIQDDSNT